MKAKILVAISVLALLALMLIGCTEPQTEEFEIRFISNGQVIHTIKSEDAIVMPTNPEMQGYVFDGWYYDITYENPFTVIVSPKGEINVYAKWLKKCSIVLGLDGGTLQNGEEFSFEVIEGKTIGAIPTPTKNGYEFLYWTDSAGNKIDRTTVVNKDLVLVAKWRSLNDCIDGTSNHSWGDWERISEATCQALAIEERVCSICERSEQRERGRLGVHTYESEDYDGETGKTVIKEPTCAEDGVTMYSCTICGNSTSFVESAIGHSFNFKERTPANCISGGYDLYECSNCHETEKRNETSPSYGPSAHDFQSVRVEPTCTKAGYTDTVCIYCGSGNGNRIPISPLGHDYTAIFEHQEPTCTSSGYIIYECANGCRETVREEGGAALGHTYEREEYIGEIYNEIDTVAGTITYFCGECDAALVEDLNAKIDTKTDKSQKWKGQTLDCLAGGWGADGNTVSAWSQPELYVKGYYQYSHLGQRVNTAVWERQKQIESIYGVTMVWHRAKSNASMQNELQTGLEADAAKFHIATPRGYEMQGLIAADTVYDLANSKYIDLTKSYYNQASVDSLSVYGHTFFVAGDFSYLDEYTSSVIFYNQAISEQYKTFGDLNTMVKNGKWTISQLAKKSALVGADDNGVPGYQDTDTYGYGTNGMSNFFQSSGIKQVSVDKSSGNPSTYKYRITLDDPNVSDLVTQLANIKSSTWARTSWDGSYGAMLASFQDGKLLFYNEVVQKIFEFKYQDYNFKVSILPMPMQNEDQGSYYTPFAGQATVMCIPKANIDREMSEYFFDVLSWTGQDYVMSAFCEEIESRLYDDGASSREDAIEILKDYVFNNLIYDPGYIATGYGGRFLTHVQSETISGATATSSPFLTLYSEEFIDANKTLISWNQNAQKYKD